jgi:hypothetical protein
MPHRTIRIVCAAVLSLAPGCAMSTDRDGGAVGETSVSPASLTLDRVGPADDALLPDGHTDGAFDVVVTGPLEGLVLVATDDAGVPNAGQQWDTIVGDQPNPIATHYALGRETWVLGVEEGGTLLNREDGTVSIGPGEHHLTVYASNEAVGIPIDRDTSYRVVGVRPDGMLVPGPLVFYASR